MALFTKVLFFGFISFVAADSGACSEEAANIEDHASLLQVPLARDDVVAGEAEQANKRQAGDKSGAAAPSKVDFRASTAEYIAMTLFVTIGCGSAMGVAHEPGWVFQVALTFGLAITALAYTVAHYSGAQINCAVTFALVITGHLGVLQGIFNFVAQLLGAVTGAILLTAICPEEHDKTGGLGCNSVPEGRKWNAFVGEVVMTFLLVFVVFETAINSHAKVGHMAPLAIGLAVFLAHCVLIPLDGCSINPTRSFGPALVRRFYYKAQGSFDDMWIFWVGPLLGAAAAAYASTALMK